MSINFLETDPSDRSTFQNALADTGLKLHFANRVEHVSTDARIVSPLLYSELNAAFFDMHPALQLVAARSAGCQRVDLKAAQERGVTVCNVPAYGEHAVAEHTMALMLAVARRLRESIEADRDRKFSYEAVRGSELRGKTLGIIGAGRIGRRVIALARAFGMRVLAYDPCPHPVMEKELGCKFVPLDNLFAESHILSLHAPLRPETWHLLNAATLAKCRRGVLIVNTARGALIETAALLEALDSGQVGGVGLDVMEDESVLRQEPSRIIGAQIVSKLKSVTMTANPEEPDRPSTSVPLDTNSPERLRELEGLMRHKVLLRRPNVVVTPHIAFNSAEAVEQINTITVDNILAFLSGKPVNVVRPLG